MPQGVALIVGEDDPPDVVLEVDNTTDIRRGKLIAYGEWGFPEVWVETPDEGSPSRPRSLRPRVTIYVLQDGRYLESPASRAFPGWQRGGDPPRPQRAGALPGNRLGSSGG